MALDELAAMQRKWRLAMFRQNQGFHQVAQEHQRRNRDAINRAVFDSSARCETALNMVFRSAQLNNEPTMEMRKRKKLFSESEAKLMQHLGTREPTC